MINNYIRFAWRNLNKHRFFSFVNICGLAIGAATFWIIALYITDELGYDRYHEKADRIFRVVQHSKWDKGGYDVAVTSPPYAGALKADYPDVEETVRLDAEGGGTIIYQDKQIAANDILIADAGLFNIFTYHFLAGNPAGALSKPQSIVLTKTLAVKIFGDVNIALNKTLLMDGRVPNTVTAVIDDVPANSHFTFSGLRSFDANFIGDWRNSYLYTYVLLKDHADYKRLEAQSDNFYNKYLKTAMPNIHYKLELQPLTSIHLHSHLDYEMGNNGNISYVYVFSIVAILILSIAIINYINLATARSAVRVKEIGIRKVIGSGRRRLMVMLFTESVMLSVFATIVAVVLIRAMLPFFNAISGKSMHLWQFGLIKTFSMFAGFALVAGFLSGIYPALFLSGFRTIPAMKGQLGNQSATIVFRKSLVTFQFMITVLMITGSFIIYQQLHFVLNKDLGFNKSQMLTFHIHNRAARTKIAALKDELLQNPLIENVAAAGNPIGNNDLGTTDFNIGPDGKTAPDTKKVQELLVDEDFIPAMQIKLKAGRNFLKASADLQNSAIVVNTTLVNEMGWQDPVGMRVRTGIDSGRIIYSTIIGVIGDFNTYSLQHKIAPVVLRLPATANDEDNLYVRLNPKNITASLGYMQKVYSRFDSENKVDYHFLDENFASQYQTEEKQGKLLLVFTGIAISIACLGLLGLVTFTAEQRVKEIGIRKTLGAGVLNIVRLLSGELIQLVLLATLITIPIAWYAMNVWLQGFAYRIGIHWWVFAMAGGIALFIAGITVVFRSVKSALASPVKCLRTE